MEQILLNIKILILVWLLPYADGNLIVPVIKNGNEKNLLGLTKSVNDLAKRAREWKIKS